MAQNYPNTNKHSRSLYATSISHPTTISLVSQLTSPLIDIGANLGHRSFNNDLKPVLKRASDCKLSDVIITGTSVRASRQNIELCKTYEQQQQDVKLHCTVGIHPHEATRHSLFNYRQQLVELLDKKDNYVVAIGECGLDFDRNFSKEHDQLKVFENHLELAVEYNLPLFMHERQASTQMINLLEKYSNHKNFRGVIHCFTTSSTDALNKYLNMNLYIGITGWICDERRGKDLQQIVHNIPLDKLLIETDAPFLLPRTMPKPWPQINEPSNLVYVADKIAKCYNMSIDEIGKHSSENTKRLFQI
ncbi:unnamed protein product [Didymodactylos carnosus]|uniref:Deoxyribonuclease TATDN1 n=1 Tax=Didymodactylos carnosus TaxID=1234261 RepID=A0A813S4L1_9BILA|nr:unnamed protein product [Didymodactylos carnosus]CAF0857634.1 unnamed protein product [Didymodactylos carnosus]CAF3579265.1 unnamed protein product [Didymodactylos carnosus]CAF3642608.1 unnamed protein product [Didymodactylos carnosus]